MTDSRWSAEQSWAWYEGQPWLRGPNYLPSTAINSTEMWQAETFDPVTIDRELGWAEELGLNSCRVFVQYLVWTDDRDGLKARMAEFADIADSHGLSTMYVLFDDCAFSGKQPYLGPQDDPIPGVHNSGWTPSPGFELVTDRSHWPQLEAYVQDVVSQFADDKRIVAWDLYNEPGNSGMREKSDPLLQASFQWARAAGPSQPLTAGAWRAPLSELERISLAHSDVTSFHAYSNLEATEARLAELESYGRPILCTEWLSRVLGSHFDTHLPLFKEKNVGWYMWGLVNGRTQTHCHWGSAPGTPEPEVWQHDILFPDGSSYSQEEINLIRQFAAGA